MRLQNYQNKGGFVVCGPVGHLKKGNKSGKYDIRLEPMCYLCINI